MIARRHHFVSQCYLKGFAVPLEKVEAVKEIVLTGSMFARVHERPEWVSRFNDLIRRLHDERGRRNALECLGPSASA